MNYKSEHARHIMQICKIRRLSTMLQQVNIPHRLITETEIVDGIEGDPNYSITVDSGNSVDRITVDCNDNSEGGIECLLQITELRFDETNYEVISTETSVLIEAAFGKICAFWEDWLTIH